MSMTFCEVCLNLFSWLFMIKKRTYSNYRACKSCDVTIQTTISGCAKCWEMRPADRPAIRFWAINEKSEKSKRIGVQRLLFVNWQLLEIQMPGKGDMVDLG